MSQQCRPPEGAEDGSLHWLICRDLVESVAKWKGGRWLFFGEEHLYSTHETANFGWRYDRPVPPRDREKRSTVTPDYGAIAPNTTDCGMTDLERLATAVLLFHQGGEWDQHNRQLWVSATGSFDATTRTLCDLARLVLAQAKP